MSISYIPSGPTNLGIIFPSINFNTLDSYYLTVLNPDNTIIATTPVFRNITNCTDFINIHFKNSLGAIDTVPFKLIDIQHETKADLSKTPTSMPLIKNLHAINRFNIKSNDFYQGENIFEENEMDWLMELFDSSHTWLEWKGIQSQTDDYIPIVIADKKIQKRKDLERYDYSVIIDFYLSHEKITIRG